MYSAVKCSVLRQLTRSLSMFQYTETKWLDSCLMLCGNCEGITVKKLESMEALRKHQVTKIKGRYESKTTLCL